MAYNPTFASLLTEITVAIMFALALLNAWGQGRRWLSTVFWGGVAGYAAEYFIVHSPNPRYEYSSTLFWATPLGVPVAIGLGWGIVFYAATWTAQRLRIRNIAVSSLIAGVLGVNVDLSLDPVAHQHGFWRWYPPPPPGLEESTLFGVPFDNFVAWVALIGVYGFLVRWVFRLINKARYGETGTPGAALLLPVPVSGRGRFLDLIVPPAAAGVAGLAFVILRKNAAALYDLLGHFNPPVGEAVVFGIIFVVGFFAFWNHVLRSSRNEEVNAVVLLIPLYLHVLSMYLLLDKIIRDDITSFTALLVLLPLNFVAGMLAYAWPSLDAILDGRRRELDGRLPLMKLETLSSYSGAKVRATVCRPRTQAEVTAILAYAKQSSRTVTFRAGGQSFDSQALNDGIVISLERLDYIEAIDRSRGTITVGAGATWGKILKVTRAEGFVPVVMVTTSAATAGGTLSSNSVSRFTASLGREGRHIDSFQLLTPDGVIRTCSLTDNQELFEAAIGGLGYVGAVLEVTHRLHRLPGADAVVETRFTRVNGLDRIAQSASGQRPARFSTLVQSFRQSIDGNAKELACAAGHAPVALSAVVQMRGGTWGLIARSQYVGKRRLERSVFHSPRSLTHLLLQLVATIPLLRRVGYWLTFNVAYRSPKTHVDELAGYTFFEDGNRALRRFLHFLGLPAHILQQTFIIPGGPDKGFERLESFLTRADQELDAAQLEPALIDILYVPQDTDGFLLSSSRELEGFAVTFTFERLVRSIDREKAALERLSEVCAGVDGRVHLVKNVCADRRTIANMYADPINLLRAIREKYGAAAFLANGFSQRVLPKIDPDQPWAAQNAKRHTPSESDDSSSYDASGQGQPEPFSRLSMGRRGPASP
jgi:decaprenylphospho-beta-D-ribofuranose 2-oxidase